MNNLGTISFSQDDIDNFCALVEDTNPFHKRGRIPLNLVLGKVGGLLFAYGRQNNIKLAAITKQSRRPHRPLRADRIYQLLARMEQTNQKSAQIMFEIYEHNPPQNSDTLVLSGHITVVHT